MGEMTTTFPLVPETTREVWLQNRAMTDEEAAKVVLPASWSEKRVHPMAPHYGARYYVKGRSADTLNVIFDCSVFWDQSRWIHVSCSRKKRMPTYEDLCEVKSVFIGHDRQAVQVFAKREKHINIHPFCLHLWCCLDGDGLPDFGKYGTI